MSRLAVLFLCLAFAAAAAPAVVQSEGPLPISLPSAGEIDVGCPPSNGAAVADESLGHVREALQPGERLDILAVGSATVLGPDGSHPFGGFPYRMAQALKLAAPQTDITLTLRGGKGLTAEEMRATLARAESEHEFQLVLWQTGTVEAVKGLPATALYDNIAQGAGALRERSDLIIVDPQFSRFLRANTNLGPYESALERAGNLPGVILFHRFDLMQSWADRGLIDLEHVAAADRVQTTERLHTCLGRALARLVLAGAGLHASK